MIDVVVPASRIIGGYDIVDGKVVPKLGHSEIIAQVFSKTRVGVGVMGAGSLMSAIEPVIRYQRTRFRGAAGVEESSPRYQQGLQMKEDVTERLADVWATAEAASSLGFDISRCFDALELIQDEAKAKLGKGREMLKNMKAPMEKSVQLLGEGKNPLDDEDVNYSLRRQVGEILENINALIVRSTEIGTDTKRDLFVVLSAIENSLTPTKADNLGALIVGLRYIIEQTGIAEQFSAYMIELKSSLMAADLI